MSDVTWRGGRPVPTTREGYVVLLALLEAGHCPEAQRVAAVAKWTAGHYDPKVLFSVMLENGMKYGELLGGPEEAQDVAPTPGEVDLEVARDAAPWEARADEEEALVEAAIHRRACSCL